jgi:predicted GH43/DUF377 family glycosyl hydrolase
MRAPLFQRAAANPIIRPEDLPVPAAAVFNPGATEQDGDVVLLLRVENDAGFSSIHVARSADGVSNWRFEPEPILRFGEEGWRYEQWGCEDARVIWVPEEGLWYITYTAYSEAGPAIGLARSDDLVRAERICLLPFANDKDGVLLPQRFAGRWMLLHRPDTGGQQHIWSAYSTDLIHWGEPHCVLPRGIGAAWDALRVGAGPPPIRTDHGWLLIFHGVKQYGSDLVYRAGAALLDLTDPFKVIGRADRWIFQASAPYEVSGFMPNTVFPTGAIVRGDELWMYYGAADTCVCLATARLSDVVDAIRA